MASLVPRDGVAERRHVDADLMGAPGLQARLDEREAGEALEDAVAGDRALAAAAGAHRHPHAVVRVAADRRVDHARDGSDPAVADRAVRPRYRAARELGDER